MLQYLMLSVINLSYIYDLSVQVSLSYMHVVIQTPMGSLHFSALMLSPIDKREAFQGVPAFYFHHHNNEIHFVFLYCTIWKVIVFRE